MGFFGGIGAASKEGVLVKGSNYLELLSEMDTIVFDKTGTLTNGVFEVTKVQMARNWRQDRVYSDTIENKDIVDRDDILQLAASLETYSTHPIATSICEANQLEVLKVVDVEEISGHGISGVIEDKKILAGNHKLMDKFQITYEKYDGSGSVVYVAIDQAYAGYIVISDTIKNGVKEAISSLKKSGVSKTVMLTGDRKEAALAVAKEVGVDDVHYELLPAGKVEKVEQILASSSSKKRVAFVGDGINDAPVLARADIGIAMGSLGSDAAIEAADIVIMDDDIRKISKVMQISRKTMRIVKENIVFALSVKGAVLILSAFGYASMWAAVFADVGVAVIAILNSMRTLRKDN